MYPGRARGGKVRPHPVGSPRVPCKISWGNHTTSVCSPILSHLPPHLSSGQKALCSDVNEERQKRGTILLSRNKGGRGGLEQQIASFWFYVRVCRTGWAGHCLPPTPSSIQHSPLVYFNHSICHTFPQLSTLLITFPSHGHGHAVCNASSALTH